jgi:hypothetical protein
MLVILFWIALFIGALVVLRLGFLLLQGILFCVIFFFMWISSIGES